MARTIAYFIFQNGVTGNSDGSEWIVEQEIGNTMLVSSDSIVIDIDGTDSSGVTYFEIRVTPDSDYRPMAGVRLSDLTVATSTNGINESWMFDIESIYSFRCRVASITSPITIISKISKSN